MRKPFSSGSVILPRTNSLQYQLYQHEQTETLTFSHPILLLVSCPWISILGALPMALVEVEIHAIHSDC